MSSRRLDCLGRPAAAAAATATATASTPRLVNGHPPVGVGCPRRHVPPRAVMPPVRRQPTHERRAATRPPRSTGARGSPGLSRCVGGGRVSWQQRRGGGGGSRRGGGPLEGVVQAERSRVERRAAVRVGGEAATATIDGAVAAGHIAAAARHEGVVTRRAGHQRPRSSGGAVGRGCGGRGRRRRCDGVPASGRCGCVAPAWPPRHGRLGRPRGCKRGGTCDG